MHGTECDTDVLHSIGCETELQQLGNTKSGITFEAPVMVPILYIL